jgi:RNA polymerase sigma-70 factor (ECF subfamily)
MSDAGFLEETLPHLDLVYNIARRMSPSAHDAEDLVQETYLRALHGWRRRPPERVAPWLATICLNAARSEYRRRAARPPELLGLTADAPADDAAEQTVSRLEVARALDELPEPMREAVVLMDLCGFSAAEAARILGCPRNTVLSRVHRAHRRLAELFEVETP